MRALIAAATFAFLAGCAAYKPVPDGYAGPVASVSDTRLVEDGTKAQLFVLAEVDGNRIEDSFAASSQASYGQGFRLNTRVVERKVPAKPMKVRLRASHTTGAPIQALVSQARGTFFSVEGTVDFSPQPDKRYLVMGVLRKDGSMVWIQDADTAEVVTEKVTAK